MTEIDDPARMAGLSVTERVRMTPVTAPDVWSGVNEHRPLRARDLYEQGDLLGAARREADACDNDGYHITAAILRDLADKVEAAEE